MQPTRTDNELKEENLLNFVVNNLEEELPINLGENVETTTEELYEVLAGGTSINHICEKTNESPHANTVCGYLTDQFDLDAVESVGDTLLQRDTVETLSDRPVEVCTDPHLDPYYGEKEETDALYSSKAKRSTTSFHAMRRSTSECETNAIHWRFAN